MRPKIDDITSGEKLNNGIVNGDCLWENIGMNARI